MTEGKGAGDGSPPAADLSEEDRQQTRLMWLHAIDDLRHKADLTHNPLYVWEAIMRCFLNEIPIPDWCLNHLCGVATNLYCLAHGVDHRISGPKQLPGESDADFGGRLYHYYETNAPAATAERIAQALMLKRPGWDAFRDLKSNNELEREAVAIMAESAASPEGWKSPFLQRLRESREDERTTRRRRARGIALLGWNKRTTPRP